MKKRIAIFFLVMLYLSTVVSASATELLVSASQDTEINAYQSGVENFSENSAFERAIALIEEAVENMETEINIYSVGLPMDQCDALIQQVITNPRFFYLEYFIPYRSGDIISSIWLAYNMTASEVRVANRMIDAEMKNVRSYINNSMSDAEKALAVHDYMCAQFEYDLTYTNYDIYSLIRDRQGVCQAYAYFYLYVLEQLGIPCEYVSSDSMDHAWNLVKVDGEWYHVDVTFDDPIYDRLGTANHYYFLLDDATMQDARHAHTGYETNHAATDTTYLNRAWEEMSSTFVNIGGKWYTGGYDFFNSYLYIYNFNADTLTPVYKGKPWSASPNSVWTDAFMGIFEHNGTVIFNQRDGLYQYDPTTGQTKKIYSVDTADKAMYGVRLTNDTIYYCMATSPNTGHHDTTAPDAYTVHSIARADILPNAPVMDLTASATATNLSGFVMVSPGDYVGPADLIFAAYDSKNRLIGFAKETLTIVNGRNNTVTIPFSVGGAKRIKTFLFESGTIIPVADFVEKIF